MRDVQGFRQYSRGTPEKMVYQISVSTFRTASTLAGDFKEGMMGLFSFLERKIKAQRTFPR